MSDATALTVPVAGWYPDRNEANVIRWWDGQQWTEHTKSTAPEKSVDEPVSAAAFGFVPPEQNPVAQAPVAQAPVAQATVVQAPVAQAPVAQTHDIAPGWYPDNADPSIQRWWDGREWTAHTAPGAAAASAAVAVAPVAGMPTPAPGSYLGQYATPVAPAPAVVNGMATRGMAYSLVSIVLNPLGAVAIAGIVFSVIGLRRSQNFLPQNARRGQAIAGIVVGIASILLLIFWVVAAVLVSQAQHSSYLQQQQQSQSQSSQGAPTQTDISFPSTVADLKVAIAKSVTRSDAVAVTTVTCDAAAAMEAGSQFQCGVIVADGRWTAVHVQIGHAAGSGMAYGLGFGPLTSSASAPAPTPQTLIDIKAGLIVDLVQAWDSPVTEAACESSASMTLGSQFRCGITLGDGRRGIVLITIVNPGGYDVTVIQPPGDAAGSSGSGSSGSDGSGSSGSDDSGDPDVSHS